MTLGLNSVESFTMDQKKPILPDRKIKDKRRVFLDNEPFRLVFVIFSNVSDKL